MYTLRRRGPSDEVTGTVALGFAWDITARSLLLMKLATLERVLAQRVEILCMLRPTPSRSVQGWVIADAQPPEADQVQAPSSSESFLWAPARQLAHCGQQCCPSWRSAAG